MPNTSKIYDVCIIGGGPGGFAAAMCAVDLGKTVCLVEGAAMGGAGVMWGALASKTMWELAKDFDVASKTDRGYNCQGISVNYADIRKTVMKAVKEKQDQMMTQIRACSPKRWTGPGTITYKRGWGSFVTKTRVKVSRKHREDEFVTARNFVIATGSLPRHIPAAPVDQKWIFDSNGILRLKKFPKRLIIIGAGIIGCEYATIFSNFRQTRVFLVDHAERVIPYEDLDVSSFVGNSLVQNNVELIQSARLKSVKTGKDSLTAVLETNDARIHPIDADMMLVSVGRVPNLSRLNLKELGLEVNKYGCLETDVSCSMGSHIYAVGDVTQHPALVNLAEMEGRFAVRHMFRRSPTPFNYDNMSTIMFFKPAVASVGLSEKQCREKQIPFKVGWYANALLNRAIAMRATRGFVKIIMADDGTGKILGMRAAGPQASSTITSIAFLMDHEKSIDEVLKSVYPHPTMSESIQECLRLLSGTSLYKPHTFPDLIRLRSWSPEKGYDGPG